MHVIKNDFLQISNSILANPSGQRRFSKTQRVITFDESSVESGVINGWVQQCLNHSEVRNTSWNALLQEPKGLASPTIGGAEMMPKELLQLEQ